MDRGNNLIMPDVMKYIEKHMRGEKDYIQFYKTYECWGHDEALSVTCGIKINGQDFLTMVKNVERAFLNIESQSTGGYAYIDLFDIHTTLTEWYMDDDPVTILGCGCGCMGCWDLTCTIEKEFGDVVTWRGFHNWFIPMVDHSALGKFIFDEKEYFKAVEFVTTLKNDVEIVEKLLGLFRKVYDGKNIEEEKRQVLVDGCLIEGTHWLVECMFDDIENYRKENSSQFFSSVIDLELIDAVYDGFHKYGFVMNPFGYKDKVTGDMKYRIYYLKLDADGRIKSVGSSDRMLVYKTYKKMCYEKRDELMKERETSLPTNLFCEGGESTTNNDCETSVPNQNDDFSTVRSLVIGALEQYAIYHSVEGIDDFIERLENELDNFGNGYECEEPFSFEFTDRYDSQLKTWGFVLDDDGLQITDCGYVNGLYGGDSYTNGIYHFYRDGTSDKSIMELEREFEDIIKCNENTEFVVEFPEEFIDCRYSGDEDKSQDNGRTYEAEFDELPMLDGSEKIKYNLSKPKRST